MAFDPYHKWLAIPREEQPPNHYRLLGVPQFESDADVIDGAAEQRTIYLRTFQTGPEVELAEQLLNEVATARVCLLRPESKADYDASLRDEVAKADLLPVDAEVPALPVVFPAEHEQLSRGLSQDTTELHTPHDDSKTLGSTLAEEYPLEPLKSPRPLAQSRKKTRTDSLLVQIIVGGLMLIPVISALWWFMGRDGSDEMVQNKTPSAQQPANVYRIVSVTELNTPAPEINPWITPDGLEIYFTSIAEDGKPWIYSARRPDVNSPFSGRRKLLRGVWPVVSADGLAIYFSDQEDPKNHIVKHAKRSSRSASFGPPVPVRDWSFPGRDAGPTWISPDGLTILLDLKQTTGQVVDWFTSVATRRTVSDKWSTPAQVKVKIEGQPEFFRVLQAMGTADGLHLWCTVEMGTGREPQSMGTPPPAGRRVRVGVLSRAQSTGKYTEWHEIPLVDDSGQYPPVCLAPRYVAATNELFVVSQGDLCVVRDFHPPYSHSGGSAFRSN